MFEAKLGYMKTLFKKKLERKEGRKKKKEIKGRSMCSYKTSQGHQKEGVTHAEKGLKATGRS